MIFSYVYFENQPILNICCYCLWYEIVYILTTRAANETTITTHIHVNKESACVMFILNSTSLFLGLLICLQLVSIAVLYGFQPSSAVTPGLIG